MKQITREIVAAMVPGAAFGRLTIISLPPFSGGHRRCFCRCDCGNEREFDAVSIYHGNIKSCGCLKNDKFAEMSARVWTIHGKTDTTEYRSYSMMIDRCENPKNKQFKDYGGRGIAVCRRWRNGNSTSRGFELFFRDMGPKPGPEFSIERIHNDKGYTPRNCKWATRIEQANNQRPKRKGIPDRMKAAVLERQHHICILCKEPFSAEAPAQFDHRPALILRKVDYDLKVYIPDQLDPEFIEALHAPCHLSRTTGRKLGASKTATTLGSDIHLKTKFARLERAPRRKAKITSRPFPKGRKFDARR